MHELTKKIMIPVDGTDTEYRLNLMDAFSGVSLLKLITEKCLPHLASIDFTDPDTLSPAIVKAAPALLSTLTDADLRSLMTSCLNHVEQSLPAGYQPVMIRSSFGIRELEHDTITCLRLCWEEILFNLENFFPESVLPFNQEPPTSFRQDA